MIPTPNDGDRPSRFALDRYATGELSPEEAAEVEAWLADHPEGRAHLEAVEAARSEVPALDVTALRARAAKLPAEAPNAWSLGTIPTAANDNRGFLMAVPVLLFAALALLVAWPMLSGDVPNDGVIDPTYIGVRGDGALQPYHLSPSGLVRYDNRALGEGDVVGFKVDPGEHRGVVVLSLDGAGHVSVYWPESGDAPEPLTGSGVVALPGSVTLDAAPGPEIFVAVFDQTVSEAKAAAERAWQSGGAEGLADWARAQPGVDLAQVNRK